MIAEYHSVAPYSFHYLIEPLTSTFGFNAGVHVVDVMGLLMLNSTSKLFSILILEPRMVTSVSISPEDFLTVTNLLKSLNVEPIANGSKLDLSLPWDPVKHASVEMGYARSLLKREGLEEKVNEKMHHPFSSIYSETFESILNKSGKCKFYWMLILLFSLNSVCFTSILYNCL